MQLDTIREHCLAKPDVTEGFPFGESALVFKTSGRIFAILMIDETPPSINLKCDPVRALELREQYDWVQPGYHMNKKHWNTIILDGSIPSEQIQRMIDHSYQLIVDNLPTAEREQLLASKK